MSPRFFSAATLPNGLPDAMPARTAPITLTADAHVAGHLRVLRMREGDALTLFDGSGVEWAVSILRIEKRAILLSLDDRAQLSRESPLNITLVQSLASAEKMDWIVQKATELGVARIVPVRSTRSTLRLDAERAEKKHAHWCGIAIAACEQCGRNTLPVIEPIIALSTWLAAPRDGVRFALHPPSPLDAAGAKSLVSHLSLTTDVTPAVTIVIGPEGGFDAAEIDLLAATCTLVTLGSRVLRTETAGLAAIAVLQSLRGDFS